MAEVQPITSQKQLPIGQSHLRGRIASSRRLNTNDGPLFLTVVKLPAPDQFSHPATIELRSRNKLGDNDTEWDGVVGISGFPRAYNTKPDPETGEVRQVRTADNQLFVVE